MLLRLGGAIDEGMALLERSCLSDHAAISYRLNAAMCSFAAGELANAQDVIDRMTKVPPRYLPHLVVAIVCAATGQTERASQALQQAYGSQADLRGSVASELRKWILDSELANRALSLIEGLATY